MKRLLITLTLLTGALSFAPSHPSKVLTVLRTNVHEEITSELEELGDEIKPHIMHDPKGFEEFHESLIHKLRKELHERDVKYQKTIKELKQSIDNLTLMLQTDEEIIAVEDAALRKMFEYRKEHESIRRLLLQAVKLTGKRIGNGVNSVLRFLRLKKRDKSSKK